MKKEWFTSAELADAKLPGMPHTRQGVENFIAKAGVRSTALARQREGQGGGFEYHYRFLPSQARQKLAFMNADLPAERTDVSKGLWAKFEALTNDHKAICRKRLDTLVEVEEMKRSGIKAEDAIKHVCRKAAIDRATLYRWREMVEGHARQDWLAALAPSFSAAADGMVAEVSECHEDAWNVLASDFLRAEEPAFSACYRRMKKLAGKKGWAPIPSERTLRRRMDILVPKAAQILARKGPDAAKKLFPAQRRSVAHLQAMQVTNTDGHKLDIHVDIDGRTTRVFLIGIQDVYSRKVLSWVISEAETWEAVRTSIGNMVEVHGIPEHLYMDNGRAFASKKISGGAKRRHRFKITEDEVAGLLKTLDIEGHFVKPYSGQSKPIERAWRDLAENIAKHPAMAGAYTGRSTQHKPHNYGERSVSLAELQAHAAMCIDDHNAQAGRKTEMAKGRSFDEVFAESMADPANLVRFASEYQRSLWMLTAETVTARKPDGAIHLFDNRYWAGELNQWIGKKLAVRFDPSDLHASVKVYDPQGRFLCDAACVDSTGYDCASAAREIARARKLKSRDDKAALDSARRLSALELKELMGRSDKEPAPKPARPTVTRLITKSPVAVKPAPVEAEENEFEDSFARGLSRLAGGDSAIIPFPSGNTTRGMKAGRKRAEQ
ncbi:transposase domain-containing protein [Rhizobium mayense]|uniref:Transposase domain-containing protein n=1 Tax=Rhizobium mayense TaxID=1312184 RepID=A0ABT7JZV7_9HYPH|nr:transposase domain-containing protein [Rhizobium mayense]MDL2401285.1 transposase domain-containing protein [Rhizobium mayense]